MRQLPLVGSVLNWFSPVQNSIQGKTFNLAAGTVCLLMLYGCLKCKVQYRMNSVVVFSFHPTPLLWHCLFGSGPKL